MKRKQLFVAMLATGLFTVAPAMAQTYAVKMTTAKAVGESITLQVNKTTAGVTVDWGDNNPVAYAATNDDLLTIEGTVKGSTIVLQGHKRINTLVCADNKLTAIDVSEMPSLRSLYCQNNELTTLDVAGCANLTDLNCANNKLQYVTITEKTNAALETVNFSGNGMKSNTGAGASFSLKTASLQYIDISNNQFASAALLTNTNIDVLKCSGNKFTGTLNLGYSPEVSVLLCSDNDISTLKLASDGMTEMRTLMADNNSLATLDLSASALLNDLWVANNQLTSVALPAKCKLNSYSCGGNKLSFASLPSASNQPVHLSYTPQEPTIDITSALQQDTRGYYVPLCPSWSDRNKEEYIVSFRDWLLDPDGAKSISYTFYHENEAGEAVEFVKASSSNKTGDWYPATGSNTYGNMTFLQPYTKVYAVLKSSVYPELTYTTTTFRVGKETSTGIATVQAGQAAGLSVMPRRGALELSGNAQGLTRIVSANGSIVWQGRLNGQSVSVNLPQGVYVVGGKKVVVY